MHKSTVFTVLSVLFFSVLVAPMLSKTSVDVYEGEASWMYGSTVQCDGRSISEFVFISNATGVGCGEVVVITNIEAGGNGKTVEGEVGGVCNPGCAENNLVLSVPLFEELASLQEGEVPVSWYIKN